MTWEHLALDFDTLDSTMARARQLVQRGASHGTSVTARQQTAGRGRRGRSWESPPDAGLWMTVILRPQANDLVRVQQLGLVAGIAVVGALQPRTRKSLGLKWPNDVLVEERKLAGVLLEADDLQGTTPAVLVGIGINLAATASLELPRDVAARYIGWSDLEAPIDPTTLRGPVLRELASRYALWQNDGLTALLPAWHRADILRGHNVRAEVGARRVEGEASGLANDGSLLIRTDAGLEHVLSGEVQQIRLTTPAANEPGFS